MVTLSALLLLKLRLLGNSEDSEKQSGHQLPVPSPFLILDRSPHLEFFHIALSHIYDSYREGSAASSHLTSWDLSELRVSAEPLRLLLSSTLVSDTRLYPRVGAGVLRGDRGRRAVSIYVKVLEKAWGGGRSGCEQMCSTSQMGSHFHSMLLSSPYNEHKTAGRSGEG